MIRGILSYIKNNIVYLCFIAILLFVGFGRLPYNVEMPGGTIDLDDRIKIDNKKIPLKGSYNMAYVSVVQGSIPYILAGLVFDDWDIVKTEDGLLEDETVEEANKRNKLYLEQSKNSAVLAALKEADETYEIKNKKNNVLYIYKDADTSLKVGDNIIECDGNKIDSAMEIAEALKEKDIGDTIDFKVIRNNKETKAFAKAINFEGEKKIGVASLTTFDIDSKKNITLDSSTSESGSSGGLMMALMVYSGLVEKDYTNGKKIVGTGAIDENGNVEEIGGIKYKLIGAAHNKVDIFLVPSDNYEEAMKVMKEKKYKFKLVKVATLREAIDYLEGVADE